MKPWSTSVALLALSLVACAAPRATVATTTAAEVTPAAVPAVEAPPAEAPPVAEPAPDADLPADLAGKRVCTVKGSFGQTVQLFLEWEGPVASGSLRTLAPSGNITVEKVHAERYKDVLIVDGPDMVDLVTHTAMLGSRDGKQYMRVGDRNEPWLACQ